MCSWNGTHLYVKNLRYKVSQFKTFLTCSLNKSQLLLVWSWWKRNEPCSLQRRHSSPESVTPGGMWSLMSLPGCVHPAELSHGPAPEPPQDAFRELSDRKARKQVFTLSYKPEENTGTLSCLSGLGAEQSCQGLGHWGVSTFPWIRTWAGKGGGWKGGFQEEPAEGLELELYVLVSVGHCMNRIVLFQAQERGE